MDDFVALSFNPWNIITGSHRVVSVDMSTWVGGAVLGKRSHGSVRIMGGDAWWYPPCDKYAASDTMQYPILNGSSVAVTTLDWMRHGRSSVPLLVGSCLEIMVEKILLLHENFTSSQIYKINRLSSNPHEFGRWPLGINHPSKGAK